MNAVNLLRIASKLLCLRQGRERLFLIESARWKSTRDGSREIPDPQPIKNTLYIECF